MSVDSDNTVAVFVPEEIKVVVEEQVVPKIAVDTDRELLVIASAGIGATGEKGDTGAQGPKGDTGAQGPQGDTGPPGPVAEFPGSPLLVPLTDTRNAYSGPSGRIIIASKLTADTQSRLTVDVNGVLKWGGGSALPDISLYRWQAGMLALGTQSQKGQLRIVVDIPSAPILDALVGADTFVRFGMRPTQLEWGPGTTAPDTILAREGAGILALGTGAGATGVGTLRVRALVANSWALACIIAAETNPRFLIRSHGFIEWGDGVNPQDTFLARVAGGQLQNYAVSTNYTGTLTAGSPVVTGIASTVGIAVGMQVHGPGITLNSTVLSVDSATQITLSANATTSGSQTFAVGRRTIFLVKASAAQGTWGLQSWQDSAGVNMLSVVPAQASAPSGKLQWRYGSLIYEQDPSAGDSTARLNIMPNGDRLDIYNETGSLISGFFMPGNIRFFDGLGAAAANLVLATIAKNIGIRTATEFGGGSGVIGITNAAIVPTTNPTGGGILYADNGDLKWRRPDGTVQVFGVGGAQGPPGDPGIPGESWFTGSGVPSGTLAGSIVNDWYIDSATGDYYEKTGTTTWTLRGNLRGPTGATGSQGPTGATGSQGPAGTAGTPGGKIYATTSAPPGSSYNPNDVWINPSDGNVYDWGIASPGPPVVYGWIPRGNIKGPAGPTGATGSQGPTGPAGATGTPGERWYSGAGSPSGTYQDSAMGDWYLDTANGDIYEKAFPTAWTLRANIKGPTGATGSQGIQGPAGVNGSQGPKGDTGAQGPAGATGSQGPAGTPGEKWFTGAGAPAGGLSGSIVGDWYLDSVTGDYYEKTGASAWTLRGNIKGPVGVTGAQGPPGELWFSGAGGPSGGLPGSAIGDWYIDTNNGNVYEKTGTTQWTFRFIMAGEKWYLGSTAPPGTSYNPGDLWLKDTGDVYDWAIVDPGPPIVYGWVPRAINLKGPQGPAGATGSTGSQGPAGTPGDAWFTGSGAPAGGLAGSVVNDWYLDSATGDYYEKTGTSTWTLRGNLKGPKGDKGDPGSGGGSAAIDIQAFETAGSFSGATGWQKPSGATMVLVVVYGGGGGGGGALSSSVSAGPGGGGGARVERWYKASDLAAQEPVVVGAQTAAAAAGTDGAAGNPSSFSSGETAVTAYGGGGASRGGSGAVRGGGGGGGNIAPGGSVSNSSTGGSGGGFGGGGPAADATGDSGGGGGGPTGGRAYSGGGGGANTLASAAPGQNGGGSVKGGCGGGSGGINLNAGGEGGSHGSASAGGGTGGASGGGAGGAGAAGNASLGGRGGGGGGGNSGAPAGAGGDGGAPGGGGGGGGGANNNTGGAGGRGARGAVYVFSF